MPTQETNPLIAANALAFNRRMQSTQVPDAAEHWIKQVFKDRELNFLFTFAGGYVLELITAHPKTKDEKRFLIELEENSADPLQKPQAQFYDDALEITIIPDPTRTELLQRIGMFLRREYEEGRTMISVSVSQALGKSE